MSNILLIFLEIMLSIIDNQMLGFD